MLRERRDVQQIPGEMRRRWFTSDYFDLIAWFADDGRIAAFHLHYDLRRNERVFMWREGGRLRHHAVDDGTRGGRMKMTPLVMEADADADARATAERFECQSGGVERELVACVLDELRRPGPHAAPPRQ